MVSPDALAPRWALCQYTTRGRFVVRWTIGCRLAACNVARILNGCGAGDDPKIDLNRVSRRELYFVLPESLARAGTESGAR